MKHLLLSLFFLLTIASVYPQSELQISHTKKVIGKNLKTNSDIRATEYVFPERINDISVDTITNLLTVQLRGLTKNEKYLTKNGDILLYNLTNDSLKWSKKLNYYAGKIHQQGDMIIRTEENKSYCMDIETGEDKWDIPNRIYIVDAKHRIGIGYKTKGFGGDGTLQGINLTTGAVIWDRKLKDGYEWDNTHTYKLEGFFHLNDSVLIAVVRGLHAMNVKTGKGWDYDAVTGYLHFVYGSVGDQVSNLIMDSTSIYWATKTQITRINKNGNIEWKAILPAEFTGKSTIFIKDSLLHMVNQGYGISVAKINDFKQVPIGRPYLGTFSLKTGMQLLLAIIEDKKQQINGLKVSKDTVFLVFKNRISKYNDNDASLISEKTYVLDSLKELKGFVDKLVYIKADSTYKRLESIDSTKHYVWTEKEKVLKLNENLEIMNEVDVKQFYYLYLKTKDYRFIAKENETIILDKADKIVATLQASSDAKLIGSKLYVTQKQNLVVIDLALFSALGHPRNF